MKTSLHARRRLQRMVGIGLAAIGIVTFVGFVITSPSLSHQISSSGNWLNPWANLLSLAKPSDCGCKVTRVEADIQNLGTQLQIFEVRAGRFPAQAEGLKVMLKESRVEGGRRIPRLLDLEPLDRWGRPYQYRQPAVRSQAAYDLFSLGADGIVSPDDVGNW